MTALQIHLVEPYRMACGIKLVNYVPYQYPTSVFPVCVVEQLVDPNASTYEIQVRVEILYQIHVQSPSLYEEILASP